MNGVSRRDEPSESAAAIVTSLKVEPGSYMSVIARLRRRSAETLPKRFASKPGATAIARTAPVRGSRTIADAAFACQRCTVSASTASAFAWIWWSIVRRTSLPACSAFINGYATGMSLFTDVLAAKQLELIRELVPKASAIGILVNPDNPITEVNLRHTQDEAHKLGLTVHVLKASTESHLDAAFATVAQQRIAMVLVGVDTLFNTKREHIIALAASHLVPAVYQFRMFPISGGLISYGANVTDAYRQVGVYTGRILKGAKPADLPVVQPTRFELVINLKTAKALGLEVPWFLQQRADEVIE